uniref:Uncharacterized protein n=1 Tax=Esox lucius TaxID=8010 RepID=A0AAY5K9D4_ESOLU
ESQLTTSITITCQIMVGVLPFPPKSPDLNVFRHIWDAMQHVEVWGSFPTEYLLNLVESMPHRISACIWPMHIFLNI